MSELRETAAMLRQAAGDFTDVDLDQVYEFLSQEEKDSGTDDPVLHLRRRLIEKYDLSVEEAERLVEKYLFDAGSRGPE